MLSAECKPITGVCGKPPAAAGSKATGLESGAKPPEAVRVFAFAFGQFVLKFVFFAEQKKMNGRLGAWPPDPLDLQVARFRSYGDLLVKKLPLNPTRLI